jgi:hypothetical protein
MQQHGRSVPPSNDLIPIREYDGQPPIGDDGVPVRERVVWLTPYRTGKMRRMAQNALVRLENGEPVLSVGDREQARNAAAIVAWEGPGLDGLPIAFETLDALPFDRFFERVYAEIERRYGDRAAEGNSDPKASASTPMRTAPPSETVLTLPARGPSNTFKPPPGLDGPLINWTA